MLTQNNATEFLAAFKRLSEAKERLALLDRLREDSTGLVITVRAKSRDHYNSAVDHRLIDSLTYKSRAMQDLLDVILARLSDEAGAVKRKAETQIRELGGNPDEAK